MAYSFSIFPIPQGESDGMVCLHYTRQGGTLSRLIFRDLSRAPVLLTCSHVWRGRYEDAVASSTAPRGFGCTCGTAAIDLQSAYILCFFIRNRRYSLCFFWLHQGRIPRHTCRFYCCLAAHQRTRKKDSAEPSFPILWTPPHPPGVSAAAGHICCRGLGAI